MRHFTLALLIDEEHQTILLGRKKTGDYGIGTLNGPGGSLEDGESPLEGIIRETREEFGIELALDEVQPVATLTCHAGGTPDALVHVFISHKWSGAPKESDEMIPTLVPLSAIPYEHMLEGDRHWMPRALNKNSEPFCAHIFYANRARGFVGIEFDE